MFPYTAEVLASVIANFNHDWWPLPAAAAGLMLGAVLLAVRPQPGGGKVVGAALAAAWAWVAVGWHFLTFAEINFAAPIYGLFFLLQAALLLWIAVSRGALRFAPGIDGFRLAGVALAAYALFGYPMLTAALGGDLAAVRLAGMAPGPTALLTLGLLLAASGRAPISLAVVPLLWCAAAGATAWLIAVPEDLVLPIFGVLAALLLALKNLRAKHAAP
ncbi:MAG: DUF6064 family protein [Marivibrio sp.]|uniref:DUF6064 family protein n=1 Tax=Marivibrio sp. TaxID=2039719 RepID=UPI0032EC52CC